MGDETSAVASRRSLSPYPIMGLAAWAQARRRLPFGDRLVRHPQRQAAAPPKTGFIGSPIPDLEFHLPEMMPAIGVVLVRHQKETRSVASRTAFYRLLPPKRQTSCNNAGLPKN